MDAKKFVFAWLGAFAVTFLLAFLWHAVILADFYTEQTKALARAEPNMLFLILGQLVLTLLMACVYPIGYKGGSPAKEGFRFGALIGLIAILPLSLVFHAIWNYPLAAVLVDSAWHIVEEGVGGLVIGMIYGSAAQSE